MDEIRIIGRTEGKMLAMITIALSFDQEEADMLARIVKHGAEIAGGGSAARQSVEALHEFVAITRKE